MNKKFKYLAIALVAVLYGSQFLTNPTTVEATSLIFCPPVKTSYISTTTRNYMTPGTGTTTLTFDSICSGKSTSVDDLNLMIQFTASSTNTILRWNYEFSQDGSDWYPENLNLFDLASTSQAAISANTYNIYSWQYASSTLGTSQAGTANKILKVPTPTRFSRVVFYVPVGLSSGNASVYAELVGKGQKQ